MAPTRRWRRCFAPGCITDNSTVFALPSEESTRARWLTFIYGDNVPMRLPKNVFLCQKHFRDDCFLNLREVESGFSTRLKLNTGSSPTITTNTEQVSKSNYSHVNTAGRRAESRRALAAGWVALLGAGWVCWPPTVNPRPGLRRRNAMWGSVVHYNYMLKYVIWITVTFI